MREKRKRIGIMGGTFDPIHIGHLILGETAYEQFQLDKVLFMPAGNPPHKEKRKTGPVMSSATEMVKRAIASNPHFELSLEEMPAGWIYLYLQNTGKFAKPKSGYGILFYSGSRLSV